MQTPRQAKIQEVRILREKRKRDAEESLGAFVKQAWHINEPGRSLVWNWHIDAICEHLQAVTARDIRNLMINIPPRHMKSTLVSVMWPAWVWGPRNMPTEDWLFGSYSPKLASRDSMKCRRILQNGWYIDTWGNAFNLKDGNRHILKQDQNEKMNYENNASGVRASTSVGGVGTGMGADVLVIDDAHKVKGAESEVQRESVIYWMDNEMSTRGNDPETFCKVIIMQRVHAQDLCGHVKSKGNYEELVLPFEFEPKLFSYAKKPPLPTKDPRTKPGELMWAHRYTRESADELKTNLNAYQRSGQLQQNPTPKEGTIFKREWFNKRWTELPERFDHIIDCWDLTFGGEEGVSIDVGYKIGKSGPNFYVMEEIRRKMTIIEQLTNIPKLKDMHDRTKEIIIENAAAGKAVAAVLKKKISGVFLVTPKGSKEDRADSVTYLFEAGNVYFPADHTKPWAEEAVEEIITFGPKAAYKDRVDALVHGIERLEKKGFKTFTPESFEKLSSWALS